MTSHQEKQKMTNEPMTHQEKQKMSTDPLIHQDKNKKNIDPMMNPTENITSQTQFRPTTTTTISSDTRNESMGMGMGIGSEKKTSQEHKPSSLDSENQDYWHYCSHSYSTEDDKDSKYKFDKHKSHGKKMDTLICNSNEMLQEYFGLKYQLPLDLLQTCKGILFLRIWKGGLFLGGISGTGIVMARHNQKWSAPCAVSCGGLQIGFQVGIERVDDILLLHDDAALKLFIESGHFRLGVDASIAVGNFGRDSNMGVVMSQGGESKSIYSYSFAKGAFVGISLDGGTLSIDDKVNEEFYSRKVDVKDIFYGDMPIPQHNLDFTKLIDLLNSLTPTSNLNVQSDVQNVPKP